MADTAKAQPTKKFFVSMLTRDITLEDAILDLIDNCLDGALRQAVGQSPEYAKHHVHITLSSKEFRIQDNCGGISREIAKNYAFKMGRETDDNRDSEEETIGMYGVGMKRALFKMGRDSTVHSKTSDDQFAVPITPDWLDSKEWAALPIVDEEHVEGLSEPGTLITVAELHESVARHFENPAFLNDLTRAVGEHFTTFLQWGFGIKINGDPVPPVKIEVLVSKDPNGPAPYFYRKQIGEVLVTIVVGLNTGNTPDDDEEEEESFERNRSAATAGWTIFCNDRAVIVGDKGRLSGWGDGIPLYHGQFSVITGIVEFRSAHADQLPVTTTKRALDTASPVWLEARARMREGIRIWITHTNTWKNHPRSDQTVHWRSAAPMSISEAAGKLATLPVTKKQDGGIEFNPQKKNVLPIPEGKKPTSRRIVYARPIGEIKTLSRALFDRDDEKPGLIGDKCFELVLAQALLDTEK